MGAEQSTLAGAPSNAADAAAAGAAAAAPLEKQGPPKALVVVGPSGLLGSQHRFGVPELLDRSGCTSPACLSVDTAS
jgi:hypothetical protein